MQSTQSIFRLSPLLRFVCASSLVLGLSACSQEADKASATVASSAYASTDAAPSTFARFVPERKDDFAWENDLVAFRAYGPALRSGGENAGVDCWLKRVDYPIINSWYQKHLEQDISYHQDHGEGLDNYHVGASAGCGGTSSWLNGERVPLEAFTTWEILQQTQDKTVFKLTYENDIDGVSYGETKLISIELGKRLYQVESTFTKDGSIAADLPVTVGLTTHDEKAEAAWNTEKGWLMAWETLGDHDLGTAVTVDPARIQDIKVISSDGVKDAGHAVIILNTDAQGKISYQAGYGWQGAGVINTKEDWADYLNNASN